MKDCSPKCRFTFCRAGAGDECCMQCLPLLESSSRDAEHFLLFLRVFLSGGKLAVNCLMDVCLKPVLVHAALNELTRA